MVRDFTAAGPNVVWLTEITEQGPLEAERTRASATEQINDLSKTCAAYDNSLTRSRRS